MRLFRRGEAASTLDLLVAGLGNPGREHARDRHNVGWMVVDELARRHDGSFRSKFSGRLAEVRIEGRRVALLQPETYMNVSGRSIGAAARFFKVAPEDLLVVHDDVDLDVGRLQARLGGGLAGHNGLRSIAQELGTQEFLRLRVGVGRPSRGDPRDIASYVLSPFEPEDDVEAIVARSADAVETLLNDGLVETQQRFN
jgi:PTH1 family peptidyl-tRNA hydrolase